MDQYLVEGASFQRLMKEYRQHGNLYIGYDFDGTIHDYHKTGEEHEMVMQLLRDLKKIGCTVMCWTAYEHHDYVYQFAKDNDIPCDGINCNAIPLRYETRKPFYSALLDDRAGLIQVYNDLRRLADFILKEKAL